MEYVSLGKIVDSFRVDGTAKIYSTTNMSKKRYMKGSVVYLYNPQTHEYSELNVIKHRHSEPFDFVKFEQFNTPEEIKELKGQEIRVIKDQKDLEKDSYFYSDLRGCKIIDKTGKILGVVKEVEEFPAQLTLRVSRDKKPDFFVPFIKQFILNVDIEKKEILIEIIEGLLWKLLF